MVGLRFACGVAFLGCFAACGSGSTASDANTSAAPANDAAAETPDATTPRRAPTDAGAPPVLDATTAQDAADAADAAPADAADAAHAPLTVNDCFGDLTGPVPGPDYQQYNPVLNTTCSGTHHQNITGVEKLVFLGDSITVGTPPTLPTDFYAVRLMNALIQKFGPLEVSNCAVWGADMSDLLEDKQELAKCFPDPVEQKKTLVVMTNGGNDIAYWAHHDLDTPTAMASAEEIAGQLRAAVNWIKDPVRFPNGSYVVYSNVYEFTDTSGDLLSCPAASLAGFTQNWPQGAPAIVHLQEQMMKVAVDTQTDMVFLLEHFCGHGYRRDDPSLQCYRGPNTELWFDLTCIHPTPNGHGHVADLFRSVIDG